MSGRLGELGAVLPSKLLRKIRRLGNKLASFGTKDLIQRLSRAAQQSSSSVQALLLLEELREKVSDQDPEYIWWKDLLDPNKEN